MGSPDRTADVEILAEEAGTSTWGAPLTHDGCLPVESVIWVERLTDITEDGWERIFQTAQINWVIIPMRKD